MRKYLGLMVASLLVVAGVVTTNPALITAGSTAAVQAMEHLNGSE